MTAVLLVYLIWCLSAGAWFATQYQCPLDRWCAGLFGGALALWAGFFPVAFAILLISRF